MKRLTFHEPDGQFGVVGMNAENQDTKLYACVKKLRDYEDTGLSPDEAAQLKEVLKGEQAYKEGLEAIIEKLRTENAQLKSQLAASQRRERAVVEFIRELRSDDSGDWGDIMFEIDEWMERNDLEEGEKK